ncbi:hypothetical protein EJV47_06240 [Hymenobacter gummosus]|uniref:Intradiol ring-cleavage dioxygenases domain-containing protein n=1 Tax=Hymenobacter gummosus TaxID=1776032 RepID=A0A431U545_9BACT|nr:hypothetical protein [Hymenobacter gummosus]RTQ51401.1 hypothetical protein EJV47_06240 [Hymenobacter gummosus]
MSISCRILALLGLCGWSVAVAAQSVSPGRPRYRAAYRLIRRTPEFREFTGRQPRVAVYDSLIRADRTAFAAELLFPRPLSAWRLDSLAQVDQAQPPARFAAAVARLTNVSPLPKGTFIVAFAPVSADCLFTEVSYNQYGPNRFSRTPTFGQTLLYLIYFGPKHRPSRVHTHMAAYN